MTTQQRMQEILDRRMASPEVQAVMQQHGLTRGDRDLVKKLDATKPKSAYVQPAALPEPPKPRPYNTSVSPKWRDPLLDIWNED